MDMNCLAIVQDKESELGNTTPNLPSPQKPHQLKAVSSTDSGDSSSDAESSSSSSSGSCGPVSDSIVKEKVAEVCKLGISL